MTIAPVMTFGSLFCGIGGGDLGLEQAGMTPLWQIEWDMKRRTHWLPLPTAPEAP